jgi:hypothetical protein
VDEANSSVGGIRNEQIPIRVSFHRGGVVESGGRCLMGQNDKGDRV